MWLSKDKSGKTACQLAVERGHIQLLEKLWEWVEEMQLNLEEL